MDQKMHCQHSSPQVVPFEYCRNVHTCVCMFNVFRATTGKIENLAFQYFVRTQSYTCNYTCWLLPSNRSFFIGKIVHYQRGVVDHGDDIQNHHYTLYTYTYIIAILHFCNFTIEKQTHRVERESESELLFLQ